MLLSHLNYSRYVGMEGLSKPLIQSCYFRQLIILGDLVCKFLSANSSLHPPSYMSIPPVCSLVEGWITSCGSAAGVGRGECDSWFLFVLPLPSLALLVCFHKCNK